MWIQNFPSTFSINSCLLVVPSVVDRSLPFSSYCRQPFSEDVPDVWLCQACEIGSMNSPRSLKEDLPRTLTPNPADFVDHEYTCSAGPSKLPNNEEIVQTGKVEQTPFQEVRGLLF